MATVGKDTKEEEKDQVSALVLVTDRVMLRRLASLVKPHIGVLIISGLCQIVSMAAFLAIPYTIRQLADSAFVHRDAAGLNRVAVLLLGIAVVSAIFNFVRSYLLYRTGGRIVTNLRIQLYEHLQSLSLNFFGEHRVGDVMSRFSNDATMVQTLVTDSLLSLVQQIATLVAVTVIVVLLDWRLALVTMVMAPSIVLVGLLVGRWTRRKSRELQAQLGIANIVLEETLSSQSVVKAFGREQFEIERYGGSITRAYQIGLSVARIRSLFDAVVLVSTIIGVAAVLWVGGKEVLAGRMSPGGLIAFIFYLTILAGPIQGLASLYATFQAAAGGASRVFELLDEEPAVVDAPNAIEVTQARGHIQVENVTFAYKPELPDVLRGVSFEAKPGQVVALVGPSGAGKTTLVSLLLRFYDPKGGAVLLDGHDLRQIKMASLRRNLAVVPQEGLLFGTSVHENIGYGRVGADDAAIEKAAKLANAHQFIMSLPEGYDTLIGDRGIKLSGGQRQRISIARAILKDPRVLILDEATSSLDNESEALVQDALERFMPGRTTIVIAHRLTTVERADLIVVMDDGEVVEQGTHFDLMEREGLYFRLYTRAFEEEDALLSL